MSASLNECNFIGRLGADPEMRYTPNGACVTSFRIAVDNSYKDKEGNKVASTDWFKVECWNRLAEVVNEYMRKGQLVFVQGRLKIDEYEQDGAKKYYTKIIARMVQMLDRAPEGGSNGHAPEADPLFENTGQDELTF